MEKSDGRLARDVRCVLWMAYFAGIMTGGLIPFLVRLIVWLL